MKDRKGFTLIELMLVIAIIGILAAIALPAFIGQREKAKMREADVLAGDLRKDVQEFYWHTGRFPVDNAEAGLPEPEFIRGQYVDSIAVKDGAIFIKSEQLQFSDDYYMAPAIFVNDPTAPILWNAFDLPPGYESVGGK